MRRFEERITIDSPAGKVFDYVSDFTRHGEWSGHGLEVSKTTDGPVAVGSEFSTVAKQFGTQREKSTVTEVTPGKTFAWDSTGALGQIHHWFTVAEEGGSTFLAKGAELVHPSLLAKVMGWRISRDMPKGLRSDLAKIKDQVQGASA
jgi:uncharacterized membrane protein